jgi:hypothetical protein
MGCRSRRTRVLFWVRSSVARLAWGEGLLLRSSYRRPICGRARRNRIGSCSHRLGRDGVEPPGRVDRRHGWDVSVGQASIRQCTSSRLGAPGCYRVLPGRPDDYVDLEALLSHLAGGMSVEARRVRGCIYGRTAGADGRENCSGAAARACGRIGS